MGFCEPARKKFEEEEAERRREEAGAAGAAGQEGEEGGDQRCKVSEDERTVQYSLFDFDQRMALR